MWLSVIEIIWSIISMLLVLSIIADNNFEKKSKNYGLQLEGIFPKNSKSQLLWIYKIYYFIAL